MSERLKQCRIIEIPRFTDHRGSLAVVEGPPSVPFEPKRFYYIYEHTAEARRAGHAHKTEQELILALAGSFKVTVNDGHATKDFELNRPDRGLYVPALVWHEVHDFAVGSVCGVLASQKYAAADYICGWEEFVQLVGKA